MTYCEREKEKGRSEDVVRGKERRRKVGRVRSVSLTVFDGSDEIER
jgi:hypothetical protein